MSSDGTFKPLQDNITSCLVEVTRTAGQLASRDLSFLRTTDPAATKQLDRQNARLLNLTRRLCRSAAQGTDVPAPELPNLEALDDNWRGVVDLDDNWRGVVDLVDNLLERADGALDEFKGVIKKPGATQTDAPGASDAGRALPKYPVSLNIPKPQRLFRNVPKNDETTAFKPLLRSKPHAIVPFEESIAQAISEENLEQYDTGFYLSIRDPKSFRDMINAGLRYKHPYEREINESEYPPSTYSKAEPIPYTPFESTSATYLDTLEGVAQMLEELKEAKEIAVDLEHHDTHSYIGIVCLMQISTRSKDWIVDTLKPWREDLQILNEVFADPRILKVCP